MKERLVNTFYSSTQKLRPRLFEYPPTQGFGVLEIGIDQQLAGEDLLPNAGVPLRRGERYYALHMRPVPQSESVVKKVMESLVQVADCIQVTQVKLEALGRKPIENIVGVTHLGLGRLAMMAGFECSEIEKREFYKWRNIRTGWAQQLYSSTQIYQQHTNAGKAGRSPKGYAAIHMKVDDFVKKWSSDPEGLAARARAEANQS